MRVLFEGLGSIGQRHARLIRELYPQMDIIAHRSSDRPSGIEGITEVREVDSALETDPDIAFVTNPTFRHVDTALRCARAGCHLFIEKPLSDSLDGVDELLSEVDRRDLITYMGCNLRFHPAIRSVREAIQGGESGDIYSYRIHAGSYLPDWRPDRDYRDTYSARASEGGGVVLDLVHELDYARWLFGPVESVTAVLGSVSSLEIDAEDVAEIVFRHSDGTIGSIHLDYYRREERRTIEITGSRGLISANLIDNSFSIRSDGESRTESFDLQTNLTYRKQLHHFIRHVQNESECENDIRSGKRILELALDAKGAMNS